MAQKNILVDAGLIEKIIVSFESDAKHDTDISSRDVWDGKRGRFAGCRKPIMGHVIHIAQVGCDCRLLRQVSGRHANSLFFFSSSSR